MGITLQPIDSMHRASNSSQIRICGVRRPKSTLYTIGIHSKASMEEDRTDSHRGERNERDRDNNTAQVVMMYVQSRNQSPQSCRSPLSLHTLTSRGTAIPKHIYMTGTKAARVIPSTATLITVCHIPELRLTSPVPLPLQTYIPPNFTTLHRPLHFRHPQWISRMQIGFHISG